MIKLLLDINPLVNSQKSGVGYYTERLLIALAEKYPEDLHITAHYNNFWNKKNLELPQLSNVTYKCNSVIPSKLINILRRLNLELPIEILLPGKVDFIIYTNFVGYRSLRKTPSAVVVHDLGYLDYPQYLQTGNQIFLKRFVPKSVGRSRFVITISEFTKKRIQKYYEVPAENFVLTPIPPLNSNAKPVEYTNIKGNYILFVSTLEPRKNFIGLVEGYMNMPESIRKKYGLVLAGGMGWNVTKEIDRIKMLQQQGENIVLTSYITESEKNWLIQNAALFALPSHYEGFGMPILEAMAAGTPTAISNIDVFHEVAGDASVYFNQNNPKSVATVLQNVLSDEILQKKLVINGYKQISNLNWGTIASRVYGRILIETTKK